MFDFSNLLTGPLQWGLFFFCAIMVGMSKTGLQGIGTLTIPILAFLFGAKSSTVIFLPILCMADIVSVVYYRRNTRFIYILKLIPWAVAGLFLAIAAYSFIHPSAFKRLMAICILLGLAVMFWSEHRGKVEEMAASKLFGPAFGTMGGFTTMIGNAAGPIMSVYLLSMKLPKYLFISTAAWFFLVINYLKLPLQIFFWKNITIQSCLLDLTAIPFVLFGAFVGVKLVAWLPEKNFRMVIIVLTIISTLMLLY